MTFVLCTPAYYRLQSAPWFQPVLATAEVALNSNSTDMLLAKALSVAAAAVLRQSKGDHGRPTMRRVRVGFMRGVPIVAVATWASIGCTSEANITRVDSPGTTTAHIKGSSPGSIYVEDANGGRGSIPREAIEDIDHPGNVAAIIGTVVVSLGLPVMASGIGFAATCRGELCGFFHVLMTLPGGAATAAGLPPMIWGWVVWTGSVNAATSNEPPSGRPANAFSVSF